MKKLKVNSCLYILMAVVVCVFTWLAYFQIQSHLDNNNWEQLFVDAKRVEFDFKLLIDGQIRNLTHETNKLLTTSSYDNSFLMIDLVTRHTPGILGTELRVFMPNGDIYTKDGFSVPNVNTPSYKDIYNAKTQFSFVQKDYINPKNNIVSIYSPVTLGNKVICMMALVIPVENLQKVLKENSRYIRSNAFIIDKRDGCVVASLGDETKVRNIYEFDDYEVNLAHLASEGINQIDENDDETSLRKVKAQIMLGKPFKMNYRLMKNADMELLIGEPSKIENYVIVTKIYLKDVLNNLSLVKSCFITLGVAEFVSLIICTILFLAISRKAKAEKSISNKSEDNGFSNNYSEYKDFYYNTGTAFWAFQVSKEGDLIGGYASDELYELLGEKPSSEDLFMQEWIRKLHPEDKYSAFEKFTSLTREDSKVDYYEDIYRIYNEKEYIYVKAKGKVKRDIKGVAHEIIGTLINCSREKNLENSLEQSQQIIKTLCSEFSSAYLIDLNNNTFDIISMPEVYKGEVISTNIPFDEATKMFAQELPDEYSMTWENFGNPDFLFEYVKTNEKREFVFKSFDHKWKKAVFKPLPASDKKYPKIICCLIDLEIVEDN